MVPGSIVSYFKKVSHKRAKVIITIPFLCYVKRIGLLSDTHGYLDERIFEHFQNCDEIWHAGDIGTLELADELEAFKPLKAVYGNIDGTAVRAAHPEHHRFNCEGMSIWMTHIGGRPSYYDRRVYTELMRKPPDIFVCGHSHILRVIYDKKMKILYINPGAAGKNGLHNVRTIIRFTIDHGKAKNMEVIELGKRA